MPIEMNRPTPSSSGKKKFRIPSTRNTQPTSTRRIRTARLANNRIRPLKIQPQRFLGPAGLGRQHSMLGLWAQHDMPGFPGFVQHAIGGGAGAWNEAATVSTTIAASQGHVL